MNIFHHVKAPCLTPFVYLNLNYYSISQCNKAKFYLNHRIKNKDKTQTRYGLTITKLHILCIDYKQYSMKGYSQPNNITCLPRAITTSPKNNQENFHQSTSNKETHEPMTIQETTLPSLNNTKVNKVKTAAFIIAFGLFVLANSIGLSTCNINDINGNSFCKLYLGYLIAFCVSGLVYLLTNIAIYFKGSDTIHLACLSIFLFDNYTANFCQCWRGGLIAIFIIVIAPIALILFVVTMVSHLQHLKEIEESKRQGQSTQNAMAHNSL